MVSIACPVMARAATAGPFNPFSANSVWPTPESPAPVCSRFPGSRTGRSAAGCSFSYTGPMRPAWRANQFGVPVIDTRCVQTACECQTVVYFPALLASPDDGRSARCCKRFPPRRRYIVLLHGSLHSDAAHYNNFYRLPDKYG
jgi:hypothetical protein